MAAKKGGKSKKKSSGKSKKKSSTKKKSSKKSSKKKSSKVEKPSTERVKRTDKSMRILAGVLVAVLIIVLLALLAWKLSANASDEQVLATVNGEAIYASEVRQVYDRLPPQYQEQFTEEEILNQTITEVLILQHAEEQGIVANPGEVDYRIAEMVAANGISEQMLEQQLSAQNITREDFEEYVRRLMVLEELQESIPSQVNVSIQEVQRLYTQRLDQYRAGPGEAYIRHILVETEDEAFQALDRVNDGEPFAQVARNMSVGPSAPQGGSLGLVNNETPLVEPFKEAALDLEVGELSAPVQTQFGWHVIYRDEDLIPLDDARDELENAIRQEKAQAYFVALIENLREDARIVYFE